MDFTLYWFMFPVAILVATIAMMSGIAGAALFMPIFLLFFPMLGTEYELNDPVVSIAAALLTSTFGFASGFIGYLQKGLIDFKQAIPFIQISIPLAILGAMVSSRMDPFWIRLAYGLLMLVLTYVLLKTKSDKDSNDLPSSEAELSLDRNLVAKNGITYRYQFCKAKKIPTLIGGFLTGLLATGIGEVVMPQLLKKGKFPIPVAAATSVLIVISTFAFAAGTHLIDLIQKDGLDGVPWNLVCYTIPGVIIGGQLGPRLQGKVSRAKMIKAIALVFFLIGLAMIFTTIN